MHRWVLFAALMAAMTPASAWWGECDNRRESSDAASAEGIRLIEIAARAGSLAVRGVEGNKQLEVDATACVTKKDMMAQVEWGIERDGDKLRVYVDLPSTDDENYARLDLEIRVPAGMNLDIDDSSGSMTVDNVGALRVHDSSGSITIMKANGPVIVRDSSGSIELRDARGPVDIKDSSGSIDVRDVRAGVRISDGSGSIDVSNVEGSVEIERDGSGSIAVADIAGDFVVLRDGSGSVSHRRVGGVVQLPREY